MPENLRKHLVYFNMKVIAGNIIAGFITILLIQLVIPVHGQAVTRIWYTSAAANFNEALPIGNGRSGAMVYGGVSSEYFSLNEQTLWSGDPNIKWNNPGARNYLPLVREAALAGEYKKADSLSKFMQGPYTESYMPMGDLLITYTGISDSANYQRSLNLDSAICKTTFKSNGVSYTRTAFASFPSKALVIRNTASKPGSISFRLAISSKLKHSITIINNNEIIIQGKCPKHVDPVYVWWIKDKDAIQYAASQDGPGMSFEMHLKIIHEGGKIVAGDSTLIVEKATATTILLTAATSFNGFDKSPVQEGIDPSAATTKLMSIAAQQPYSKLLAQHIADYSTIYRRVSYELVKSTLPGLPTDARLKKMADEFDPELLFTLVQYGRYLIIASSRPGGQPANLKGLWNEKLRPEYSANWCLDHDAQMFYYPVETNNLSEMHEPFLQLIKELSENGYKTATINYGMRGWTAHHNTDIWRKSSPVGNWGEGNPHWATWNMSGPWLCAHLYNHFLFTGDTTWLKEKAWPVMKGAAEFCLDWLIENKDGKLISVPSVSPENTFITTQGDTAQISINATADIELMKDLFNNCIHAANALQINDGFIQQLKIAYGKLMPYPIGSKGQLQEWSNEWNAMDPGHRHLSHMYAVFPGAEISPLTTPDLAGAAKKALSMRTRTNGSWGFAWKAACWARLYEGDSAWATLQHQLRYVDPNSVSASNNYGLYPNLFNSEVPGIILNGNTCITAVITEMLLQSHTGIIQLLPALPTQLQSGSVKGLVAQSGFVVDIHWENKTLVTASVYSRLGQTCSIHLPEGFGIYSNGKEIGVKKAAGNNYSFKTAKGQRFTIQKKGPNFR